ncbi:MAG: RNA methyltransferase [Planctomycetota bacterium]|nr:MAG: RNA methyltransferase [Planctomycetota bacterium]
MPPIRSPRNERVRRVRKLQERRGRRREGRFLLEGPKVLREALARSPDLIEEVLYREQPTYAEEVREALSAARAAGVACHPVEARLYEELCPSESPQPLLGVAFVRWSDLGALCGSPAPVARAVVACAGVQDPGNLGTILRTAHFFGFAGAATLPGTHDPFSPKVVRSSAGALLDLPPARAEGPEALFAAADAAALTPVALVAHGGAPLDAVELPLRSLFLLGSEGQGLDEAVGRRAGLRVRIAPGRSGAESLNVAVAFAVAAHAWQSRWRT